MPGALDHFLCLAGLPTTTIKRGFAVTTLTLRWATLSLVLFSAGGAAATGPAAPAIGGWGFDLTGVDRSVNPGDDFFHYANGTWIKNTLVPPDRSRWGAFDRLNAKSETDLKAIVDELVTSPPSSSTDAGKVADFYRSYMDTA